MLYYIIKQLQEASGTNEKLAIMKANKDNQLFKEYMRLVTCPSVNFYITEKTFPAVDTNGDWELDEHLLEGVVYHIASRGITGKQAYNWIAYTMKGQTKQSAYLLKQLLLKDIRAKIGVTLVNKVWDKLCVDVPYQRCSLPDEKNLKKFKEADTFIVQTKCDGSFATLTMDKDTQDVQLYTRNGNTYPRHVVDHLLQDSYIWGRGKESAHHALEGELLCYRDGELLSRKEGNGLLNKMMQGADVPSDITIKHVLWNYLPLDDWRKGYTDLEYQYCINMLYCEMEMCLNEDHFGFVDGTRVETLEEAYKFHQEQLAKGLEGSIIKTLTHKWKNGTSKECLKLKVEAEVDLVVYDVVEGKGKASGMCGAIRLRSSCGKLEVDVGTGMSDSERLNFWQERDSLIGKIAAIKCNDLLSKEGSSMMSLFLPVLLEIREDKTEADSLERIEVIFNSIKTGV